MWKRARSKGCFNLAAYLGEAILRLGIVRTLVLFTCKDKNRNQIENELHALDWAGVQNLLVMRTSMLSNMTSSSPWTLIFDYLTTGKKSPVLKLNY